MRGHARRGWREPPAGFRVAPGRRAGAATKATRRARARAAPAQARGSKHPHARAAPPQRLSLCGGVMMLFRLPGMPLGYLGDLLNKWVPDLPTSDMHGKVRRGGWGGGG